jgi:5-methyltetrahydropteroyltriglutamate--homocysteine methyltransferase
MSEHILTTHVGSLPRPQEVVDVVFAREAGEAGDQSAGDAVIAAAVAATVARQRTVGIDLPSDGEMSKISYATYIKDRLTGFEGKSPARTPADLEAYPGYIERLRRTGEARSSRRPRCTGPVRVKTLAPLDADIANFRAALAASGYAGGFMNAASPGVIALFHASDYHTSRDAYLEELAEAMRAEYEAIVAAGMVLQIDAPDLALGRHTEFKRLSDAAFVKMAERHIEVLNHALRNVAGERVRMHVCWGNYEGPHHCDIGVEKLLAPLLKAKPRTILFEAANPRHEHEWTVWRDADLPDDLVLAPGVIDSTTNFIEHPELVAQRILRFADIVGRERVIAGTDCGFATFAGFGAVDGEIAYAKLRSLVEGAGIATMRLQPRRVAAR